MRRMPRCLEEWITDQLLTLYTCQQARKRNLLLETRYQKTVFISQWNLWKNHIEGFNYQFIRFNHGPYSSELTNDLKRLVKNEFIRKSRKGYHINIQGYDLLEDLKSILDRNKPVLSEIDIVTRNIQSNNFEEMLKQIYRKPNPLNDKISIGETKMNKYLLSRETKSVIGKGIAFSPFNLSESEAEDLEMIFDPTLSNLLSKSDEDIFKGKYSMCSPPPKI
jgi:uncharacterized protein YwgA